MPRRCDLLDLVPERFEQLGGVARGRAQTGSTGASTGDTVVIPTRNLPGARAAAAANGSAGGGAQLASPGS